MELIIISGVVVLAILAGVWLLIIHKLRHTHKTGERKFVYLSEEEVKQHEASLNNQP